MSDCDDIDALVESLRKQGPLLSCDDMDAIEAMWERQRTNRRAALVLLTLPWAELNQKVSEDRAFAVAVAAVLQILGETALYRELTKLLDAAEGWCLVALAGREDMREVLHEAGREGASPD